MSAVTLFSLLTDGMTVRPTALGLLSPPPSSEGSAALLARGGEGGVGLEEGVAPLGSFRRGKAEGMECPRDGARGWSVGKNKRT